MQNINNNNSGADKSAQCTPGVFMGKKAISTPSDVQRHETKDAILVKIDCGGETYITTEASMSNYPDTLLGDPQRRKKYWLEDRKVYYFDRNQDVFAAILYFYQSPGTFRPPEFLDPVVVETELEFFQIDLMFMTEQYDEMERSKIVPVQLTRRQVLHETITNPGYNKMSLVWAAIDMLMITMTITMLVLESVPEYSSYFVKQFKNPTKTFVLIYTLDVLVNTFFTVDLVFRFLTWPAPFKFLNNTLNVLDLLAVSPFYVELAVFAGTSGAAPPQFLALKVCRIIRVVRVLKIVRHSKQLTEVMEVVSSAKQEFVMLIGIVFLVVLLVGTVMYYIESSAYDKENLPEDGFLSILHGCWWSIVTITTVGYGDISPKTALGKLAGSLVVLFGIVVLAFPMTIIISKFQDAFTMKRLKANKEMTRKLREMARQSTCCASRTELEREKLRNGDLLHLIGEVDSLDLKDIKSDNQNVDNVK